MVELTILIVTRNEERKIAKCIESVLNSDYPKDNYEILLVDSNSEDNTVAIAQKFSIRIFEMRRASLGSALNIGMAQAHGRFIFKMDGDSEVSPKFLKSGIDILKKERNVAIVTGIRKERNTQSLVSKIYKVRFQRDTLGEVELIGGNFLFDKEKVKKIVGSLPETYCKEEHFLSIKARSAGYRIVRINEVSMIHDSSGENNSLSKFLEKNIRYSYETSVLLKNLTLREILRYKDPHIPFALINLILLTITFSIGPSFFLFIFIGIFMALIYLLLLRRVKNGFEVALSTAIVDASFFYFRSFMILVYLITELLHFQHK